MLTKTLVRCVVCTERKISSADFRSLSIAWISSEITYGLYLSDHTILGPIDTEIVVLSGIMIQNLRTETGWHLRGIRRVGVSLEDVEKIHQCVGNFF